MMTTARLEETVADVTQAWPALNAYHNEHVDGLRAATDDDVKVDKLVYVHGSGRWRPGIVERITRRAGRTAYTVVHATPTRPDTMRRKRLQLDDVRVPDRGLVRSAAGR